MKSKDKLLFFLTPLLSSLVVNLLTLLYFLYYYKGLMNFFVTNKQVDGDLMGFISIFLIAIASSIVTSILTMVLLLGGLKLEV